MKKINPVLLVIILLFQVYCSGDGATIVGNTSVPSSDQVAGTYQKVTLPESVQEKFDISDEFFNKECDRDTTRSMVISVSNSLLTLSNFLNYNGDFSTISTNYSDSLKNGEVDAFAQTGTSNSAICQLQILQVDEAIYTVLACTISGQSTDRCSVSASKSVQPAQNPTSGGAVSSSLEGSYLPTGVNCWDESDVDELWLDMDSDNRVTRFELDDDHEEQITSTSSNKINFNLVEESNQAVIANCNLTFSGDQATGSCSGSFGSCPLGYQKCSNVPFDNSAECDADISAPFINQSNLLYGGVSHE